jgi:putative flippase GtrA
MPDSQNPTPSSSPNSGPKPGLFALLLLGWNFLRREGLAASWRAVLSRDAHPLIQFGKYGCCGVLALTTQIIFYLIFTRLWFPASDSIGLEDDLRSRNQIIGNLLAFPFSNFVAYFTNRLFVFTPGRHSPWREFVLFTIIAFLSFIAGVLGGPYLVRIYGISEELAQLGFVVTSTLVNFVCRKFLVFSK